MCMSLHYSNPFDGLHRKRRNARLYDTLVFFRSIAMEVCMLQ